MNLPQYLSIAEFAALKAKGVPVSIHSMPEEYYAKWERLYATYRREQRKAQWPATTPALDHAAQALLDHENAHNCD